jgi:hypothetical protein
MRISHDKVIDCSAITAEACSDRCLAALGHKADFALMADTPTSTVHGSVSIVHNDPPTAHEIAVNVYDADEASTAVLVHGVWVGRQSTLRRPNPMPTEQAIKDRIDTLV